MKRILGTVAALASVLAFGTMGRAALITFDVSNEVTLGGELDTGSTLAPTPPGYFQTPFGAGSNVVVDETGGSASLVSGTINIQGTTDLGVYGTFISNTVTTLTGGVGAMSGENILWTGKNTHAATTGFFGCTGAICGLLGITEGGGPFGPGPTGYPISVYQAFVASQGVTVKDPMYLGTWLITGGHIDASSMAVSALAPNLAPAAWYLFGNTNIGLPADYVPEPGTFALLLLGIGGLALRSRRTA
jgi:hypothetical protein